jgi:hypothetical protein
MPTNHPPIPHYAVGQIQPIDFFESNFTKDEYCGYLKGNIIKYVARYRLKGTPMADLIKARVYLDWLIEFEEKQK